MKEGSIYSKFPSTRYQGSKLKIIPWIDSCLSGLEFDSVLDLFGGTAAVSYLFKSQGKQVHYNDLMPFNFHVGKCFISNSNCTISEHMLNEMFKTFKCVNYSNFIENNFKDIYYLDSENKILDILISNINNIDKEFAQSAMWWILGQACLSKRPYNLFHRANLYIRTADIKRSFGNKTTWDKSFKLHCEKFRTQYNKSVFDNGRENTVHCMKAIDLDIKADLVYIDPPYIPKKGSLTLYADFYHFLNGMVDSEGWPSKIDYNSKNLKMLKEPSPWERRGEILEHFKLLIEKHKESIIVISYRDDGVPSITDLLDFCKHLGKKFQFID